MVDELLDLVNENDEVIGEVFKSKANTDPSLIHREVAVILFDNQNNILMAQRSKKKAVEGGVWSISSAGHVSKADTPLDTAHRELKEELGFDTKLVFIEKQLDHRANETRFIYCYLGKYENQPITIQEEEVEKVELMNRDQLAKIPNPHPGLIPWTNRFWNGEFDNFIKEL